MADNFFFFFHPQDLALIEALWKQDVDLGVPRELYDDDLVESFTGCDTKDKDHGKEVGD